ncbi:MAG: hypothetical protein ACLU5J_06170 [Christensenellales bacterium]
MTNKGKEDAKLIRQIIKRAVETAEKQIADAAAQKQQKRKLKLLSVLKHVRQKELLKKLKI